MSGRQNVRYNQSLHGEVNLILVD